MNPNAIPKTTPFNVATMYQQLPLEDLKSIADERRLPYAIALANITGDLNTGMIIRSACIFAAHEVFIFGKKKYDRRSTVGAHHYITTTHYESNDEQEGFDWQLALHTIRINGYIPLLVEQGGTSLHKFRPRELPGNVCLVFGSEDHGIPLDVCRGELCLSIPQPGILRSLNVSAAASIAMYHMMMQLLFVHD